MVHCDHWWSLFTTTNREGRRGPELRILIVPCQRRYFSPKTGCHAGFAPKRPSCRLLDCISSVLARILHMLFIKFLGRFQCAKS